MPLKTTIVQHVYEFSFRITSEDEQDRAALAECVEIHVKEALARPHISVGQVDCRELCMEQSDRGVEYCLMTEGHRGLHEGPTGNRWGNDL